MGYKREVCEDCGATGIVGAVDYGDESLSLCNACWNKAEEGVDPCDAGVDWVRAQAAPHLQALRDTAGTREEDPHLWALIELLDTDS